MSTYKSPVAAERTRHPGEGEAVLQVTVTQAYVKLVDCIATYRDQRILCRKCSQTARPPQLAAFSSSSSPRAARRSVQGRPAGVRDQDARNLDHAPAGPH